MPKSLEVKSGVVEYFYRLVKNKSIVPRWFIFILDLLICAWSLFFAYLLRFNMNIEAAYNYGFVLQIALLTVVNLIIFRSFRSYEGIIRFSSVREGFICISAISCSVFILLATTVFSGSLRLPYLIPLSVLLIYFFVASFLVFGYRIVIKVTYHKSLKNKYVTENVLVFGQASNDSLLKNAIESIPGHQYKVIGFIEENKSLWGKSIDNTRFLSFEQAKTIAEKHKVKLMFLFISELNFELKNNLVDYCLSRDIQIKVIPAVHQWVDGQLQTRQLKNLKIEDLLNRPSIEILSEGLQHCVRGKRILVTGAAGSIGTEIVMQLAQLDSELLILCDNRETAMHELQYQIQQQCNSARQIVFHIADVKHKDVMQNVFESYHPQIVFHAAAYKHVPLMEMHPCEAIKNNVMGTKIMADLSLMYGVERFVLISTDKAINPTNVMGASKRIAEMYISELQYLQNRQKQPTEIPNKVGKKIHRIPSTRFITTRFGNVLDSNGSVIPRFKMQIEKGGPVTVTHPDIVRFFMTIPEACSLVLEAATMGNGGEIFVFDMGEQVRIADLAKKMIKLAGLIPGEDIEIKYIGLRPGEKLYEEILNKYEEVIPTHHKKIMISKVIQRTKSVIPNIELLIELAEKNDNMSVVKEMKAIVSEYKSNNSPFEVLDQINEPSLVVA